MLSAHSLKQTSSKWIFDQLLLLASNLRQGHELRGKFEYKWDPPPKTNPPKMLYPPNHGMYKSYEIVAGTRPLPTTSTLAIHTLCGKPLSTRKRPRLRVFLAHCSMPDTQIKTVQHLAKKSWRKSSDHGTVSNLRETVKPLATMPEAGDIAVTSCSMALIVQMSTIPCNPMTLDQNSICLRTLHLSDGPSQLSWLSRAGLHGFLSCLQSYRSRALITFGRCWILRRSTRWE